MIQHWLRALIELPLASELLLKVTVLLAAAWALHLLLRRGNPYWRVLLWRGLGTAVLATPLLVLVSPEIPVAVSLTTPPFTGKMIEGIKPLPAAEPSTNKAGPDLTPQRFEPSPVIVPADASTFAALPWTRRIHWWIADHWPQALLAIWAAGVALFVSRWAAAWLRLRRIVSRSAAAGELYENALRRATQAIGCDTGVQLRIAEGLPGPLLAGVRKPVILIPGHMAAGSDSGELPAVLAHELSHLHNRDLPWMAFLRGLAALLWWHPLTWRLCQAHGEACEEACDAAAVGIVGDPAAYSRTLARLALSALTPSPALAGIPMARPAQIIRRLSRLAGRMNASRPGLRRVLPAGLLGAAAALGLSGLQLVSATMAAPGSRPAHEAGRVLHFPPDRSLGAVYVQDANLRREITTFYTWIEDGVSDQWKELGPARGDVTIPPGQRVHLRVDREGWKNLAPLAKLAPDDLYELTLGGTGMTDEQSAEWGVLRNENAGDAIMPHVARLTGLKILNLNWTFVTGKGLRHVEGLQNLECLGLPRLADDEGMTHVAKLAGLKRLHLKGNNVTNKGLAALERLTQLEELELGGEKMSDEGLTHLKSLPKLYYLSLWGTTFTDAGMVHVARIPSLRIFWPFRMDTIGDEGLAHLANAPNLQRLCLCHMQKITDAGMAHVARMPALRQLSISHTKIGDAGARHLERMRPLELLELPDGIHQEALIPLLARQSRLRKLWCGASSNCSYDDEVLEQVGKMADLEKAMIAGKQITDAGMVSLANCGKLKELWLFYCPITSEGLGELSRLKVLTNLDITNARLTTSGLKQLNGMTQLTHLKLSNIAPDEEYVDLSGLVNLKQLSLGGDYKGESLRDADLAFLPKLKNLEWFQMPFCRGITDAGLVHLAGLTKMERLAIGDGLTDAAFTHLAGMKRLNSLTISGNLTEKGLLKLQQHPSLAHLWVVTPKRLSNDIADKMATRLPLLFSFSYGPDLQHMRPLELTRKAAK